MPFVFGSTEKSVIGLKFRRGYSAGLVASTLVPSNSALVFHFAAAVSGECEADFDLGLRSNIDTTRALLEACRRIGGRPVFAFASSLAVFGRVPGGLPEPIRDDTLPTPQSSTESRSLCVSNSSLITRARASSLVAACD
ncbi:NAD-dependent epimerase/dehydratase family protein [Aquabacter sp. CN5-332]|uniref:NAD-dependent epimerase/dehydratase family protein n=1 Tax=Aquabacter sp. CN5-332 TaxID=3156608 RepID=UPI0032B3B8A6